MTDTPVTAPKTEQEKERHAEQLARRRKRYRELNPKYPRRTMRDRGHWHGIDGDSFDD